MQKQYDYFQFFLQVLMFLQKDMRSKAQNMGKLCLEEFC